MTLLCFVMGQAMLISAFLVLFVGLLNEQIYKIISLTMGFCYPTWAIGQFFDGVKVISYIKAFISYMLGVSLYILALIMAGLAIDQIIKML